MKIFRGLGNYLKKILYEETHIMNYIYLTLGLFFVEIIVRLINHNSIICWETLRIFIGINILSLILSFIISYLNSLLQKIATSFIVFAFGLYSCAQLGFLKFLGIYASLQSASQAEAVKDYIINFLKSFKPVFFCTFIPFVVITTLYIVLKRRLYKVNHYRTGFVTFIAVTLLGCAYFELVEMEYFQNKMQSVSNHELFLTASNPELTVSEFGTLGFCLLDARNALFPIEVKSTTLTSGSAKFTSGEVLKGIDDIIWENIIKNETDPEYKALSEYYYSRNKAGKNDMTGKFKDKNLIVIMMESANDMFLQYPEYFPNITKIVNGGWNWENNYSPRNACATLNNEFSGMTSLYSINNTCTAKTYVDNTYFESIFGIFNDNDYYSFSAHDYNDFYYPRTEIHPNMGSKAYYGADDLGIDFDPINYKNWANDDDFIVSYLNILDGVLEENDKFMTWLTTVSGHQPYDRDSNQGSRYLSMTEGTGIDYEIRRYLSKLKYLDDGLGILLDGLEKRGILDDTVIVLYGDHYPYGLDTDLLNTVMPYDTNKDMNAEQVPFIIYNSEVTEKHPYTYTDYTTYVNILPTLANLFDIDYESRIYMGEDLFSSNYTSIAVFADGSWKNDDAFYDASSGRIKYYYSFEYPLEDIQKINNEVNSMLTASVNSVKTNYFSYLKGKVDELESDLEQLKSVACLVRDKEYYCDKEEKKK